MTGVAKRVGLMHFELTEASQASVKNGKAVLAVAKPGIYAYKKEFLIKSSQNERERLHSGLNYRKYSAM